MWSVECIVLTTNETAHRRNGMFRSYFLPKFCSVHDIKLDYYCYFCTSNTNGFILTFTNYVTLG